MGAVAALILFALAFVRTDFGIYVVIFSMLLSPQFGSKGAGVGAGRGVTFRTEDFVLLVIGLSWLAKTAVNKELNHRADAAELADPHLHRGQPRRHHARLHDGHDLLV